MHEIVTLQFGQQANYLGTHYWNVQVSRSSFALTRANSLIHQQESYFTYAGQEESPVDHDISFRAGVGADGSDTYAPRTLIYDLKGAFGTLRRENALYDFQQQEEHAAQHGGLWSGSTMPLQLPPIAPSPYQQALDQGVEPPQLTTQTVRFWSDYNHIFYHPRSIVQLNEYEVNSSLMPFEKWNTGEELFANLDREHDLLDRDLRPFLEECDQLQALQIFSSIDDAWGGFTSKYLERIADEMGKGCIWVFGLKDGNTRARDRQLLQLTNMAHSLFHWNTSASLQIPLTSLPPSLPKYVSLSSSPWHTSALQIAAVESITLPARLRTTEVGRTTFDQLETTLNNDGNRKLAASAMSVDDAIHLEEGHGANGTRDTRMTNGISEDFDEHDTPLDIDLLPFMRNPADSQSQRLGRRPQLFSKIESLRGPWMSALEIEAANSHSRDPFSRGPRTTAYQSSLLFPTLSSYPQIFRYEGTPRHLAVKTALSTSSVVADQVRALEASARRLVALDEREALCDGLASMAEEYEEGWDGSDGSDDND